MNVQDFIALAVFGFGLAGFIWREFSKLGDKIDKDIKAQAARTDKLYEMFSENSKLQSDRTDKLYEMFIELLKKKG